MASEATPVIQDEDEFDYICRGKDPNWEVIQEDQGFVKHDVTRYDFLIKNKKDGKYYFLWYDQSYNYGRDLDMKFPWEPPEAEVTEVTKYTWKEKAKPSSKTYVPE